MFHRKRFRVLMVVVLTLLLTFALASVASAVPPIIEPGPGGGGGATDDNGDIAGPGGNGDNGDNGNGNGGPPPTGNGDNGMNGGDNGMNGDDKGMNGKDDMMGPSMPPSDSWPPPNAIVRHPATPVQISALGGGLRIYLIAPGGDATTGPVLSSLSALAEMYPEGDAVSLYEGVIPGSGKPVTIEYLPADMKLRVSTFYADKPPHDFDKAYIFTVDADHSVTHERW